MAETIYAPASGVGKAGVAIIRVSGAAAGAAARALSGMAETPAPRRALRRRFVDPESGELLDDGLLIWFPAPGSYTGEDVAEFQIHGGGAVRAAMLRALSQVPGCRLAEPGEFTRRAYLNGRIDLSQAEGVADLIEAETEAQRRQAVRQAEGALSVRCAAWAERLVRLAAHMEAWIDFPDEDLPDEVRVRNEIEMQGLIDEFSQEIEVGRRGERLREGLRAAIVGPPNAGKSSLLNRLAGREAAIVNARAGTTRDVIEVAMDLDGYPLVLADTAGLRESADEIEAEGVRRARRTAAGSDVVIAVAAADDPAASDRLAAARREFGADRVVAVVTKSDLGAEGAARCAGLWVSATTGAGVDALVRAMTEAVEGRVGLSETAGLTRARHREAVAACVSALRRAKAAPSPDLQAEDVRLALRALGRITGEVDVEDLLDVIFRDFCIGK
ncbi:MAG: tRNA uridine-5-carboxymethylaminomethyl(34) synthesis GTPase MnmE [Alphaproteobacteria bacterium]|nr:tRNA uridine-5-carboxymethylaminomethyl(34) synthesis GTPase MnmE [Alphaproteobacteria bacterium]